MNEVDPLEEIKEEEVFTTAVSNPGAHYDHYHNHLLNLRNNKRKNRAQKIVNQLNDAPEQAV